MNPIDPKLKAGIVEVSWLDRWQIYYRLQELGIKCDCGVDQPLRVEVETVASAVQLWSVVRQLAASRRDLVAHLDRCWHNYSKES